MKRSRDNFWSVSKGKALLYAFVFLGIFLLIAAVTSGDPNAVGCELPFLLIALCYGGRWLFCFTRDQALAQENQARAEAPSATPTLPAPPKRPSRLYIPDSER